MSRFIRNIQFVIALSFVGQTFKAYSQPKNRPIIQVFTDPARSRTGEPVLFKIRIESDFSDSIGEVKAPAFTDWKLLQSYRDQTTLLKIINGNRTQRRIVEQSLVLKPLKTGILKIPQMTVAINGVPQKTFETTVKVDSLNSSPAPNPPRVSPPSQGPFNPGLPGVWGRQRSPNPRIFPDNSSDDLELEVDIPPRENMFVRGIPSKLEGYAGELFTLSYRVFQRKPLRLDEPTISKFPDFKGFLKEELAIPRAFSPSPARIQGENLLQFELIRFAIFPLKEGSLQIQPLQFRAKVFSSPAEMLEDMLRGKEPDPSFSQGIPMEKYSQVLNFRIKPLPPAPAGTNFTGAVGQYSVKWEAPSSPLPVGQPFSIEFTVEGSGNLKAIEEPSISLPSGLEPYQTQNKYEFREDASGFKTFEILMLPKEAGIKKIPPLKWTFFNPKISKYETLTLPELTLDIRDTGTSVAKAPKAKNQPTESAPKMFPPRKDIGDRVEIERITTRGLGAVSVNIWFFLLSVYFALGLYFAYLKRKLDDQLFLRNNPWEKTARQIRGLKETETLTGLTLVDFWIRQRFYSILKTRRPDLSVENEREAFFEALQSESPTPEVLAAIRVLRTLFTKMDLVRFAKDPQGMSLSEVKDLFEEAQKAVSKIPRF